MPVFSSADTPTAHRTALKRAPLEPEPTEAQKHAIAAASSSVTAPLNKRARDLCDVARSEWPKKAYNPRRSTRSVKPASMKTRPISAAGSPLTAITLLLVGLALTGCATPPEQRGQAFEPPTIPTSPARIAESWRSEVILSALAHLDTPYRYGGTSASGLDCSALVQRAYSSAGVQLPRTSVEQSRSVQRRADNPVPGDIVFFAIRAPQGNKRIDHVGVYLGDGRFVHAPRPGAKVRIESLNNRYWAPRLQFAGYVPPAPDRSPAMPPRAPADPIGEFLAASGHAPAPGARPIHD